MVDGPRADPGSALADYADAFIQEPGLDSSDVGRLRRAWQAESRREVPTGTTQVTVDGWTGWWRAWADGSLSDEDLRARLRVLPDALGTARQRAEGFLAHRPDWLAAQRDPEIPREAVAAFLRACLAPDRDIKDAVTPELRRGLLRIRRDHPALEPLAPRLFGLALLPDVSRVAGAASAKASRATKPRRALRRQKRESKGTSWWIWMLVIFGLLRGYRACTKNDPPAPQIRFDDATPELEETRDRLRRIQERIEERRRARAEGRPVPPFDDLLGPTGGGDEDGDE